VLHVQLIAVPFQESVHLLLRTGGLNVQPTTANLETAHAPHQLIASWTWLQRLLHVQPIVVPFQESSQFLLQTEGPNVQPTTANPEKVRAHCHQWIASWTYLQQLLHVQLIVVQFKESDRLLLRTGGPNVQTTTANPETAHAQHQRGLTVTGKWQLAKH
jgi:hypothetical protein